MIYINYLKHYSKNNRSEEHTSELQSQSNLVCRLLLEKKKKIEHFKRVFVCERADNALQHLSKLKSRLSCYKTLPLSESVMMSADLMSCASLDAACSSL